VERAAHFYCVQDAAEYFRRVREALLRAEESVFILGWDIAGLLDLLPGETPGDGPTRLNELLAFIARRNPRLRCYVLIWDYGALYTLERDPFSRLRFRWGMPRRVKFGFDSRHPIGASHHQKMVVADDSLAFCGGIDLTTHRWDTREHPAHDERRVTPLGEVYGPYHEIQAMVDGQAAASLGMVARFRWQALSAERLPPVRPPRLDRWPAGVEADLHDVDVAISLTHPQPLPAKLGRAPVRQCEALFVDAIAAARRTIYIESQYLTNAHLADRLAARLDEPDGPEVVVVSPSDVYGWLEQNTIGPFRERVCRRLIAADRHNRLRLVYPVASRRGDIATFVHSKVMIVDDWFARIGSANFNYRSMGVDTECDLAVDAGGDGRARAGVLRIRDRLLGEHLGLEPGQVAPALARARSLAALIDARNAEDRTLARIELPATQSPEPSEVMRAAVDPDEPIALIADAGPLVLPVEAATAGNPVRFWILSSCVLAAALVVAWASGALPPAALEVVQQALEGLPRLNGAQAVATVIFAAGGVALIPLEPMAVATGVLMGLSPGAWVALAGSIAAAAFGYLAGRIVGRARVSRWMSGASFRAGRPPGMQGLKGIILLHLASVITAGATHLLCGANRVPFGAYMAGSLIGLLPSLAALTSIGALLRLTLLEPSLSNGLLAIGTALGLLILVSGTRTLALIRPARARQRRRAQFG
jgi:phosphatidylserine/phosphatidylglycerophosphate/cardiolipin synthase-like enzyme/uncharacterized membrane protein YdjX (TVP38/TMEM64 family)